MAFTPSEKDSEYSIDNLRNLQFDMKKAIAQVFNNEYILIVGSEVILNPNVEPSGDVGAYLLKHINRQMKSHHNNFDEVMRHAGPGIDPIRNLLHWESFSKSMVIDDVSEELQGLLRTHLFKVVITTTFDSYLEILMRDIWGDDLHIVNIWDASSLVDFYERLKKYKDVKNYCEPTLIYAFGKCENREGCCYARKDFEYIQTIERWMEFDKRENLMMKFILSKRLMSIGCKFDDWYFRFFWYILRREEVKQSEGDIAIAFDREDRSDQKLENYLKNSRVITQTEMSAREFIQYLTKVFTSSEPDNPYCDLVLRYRRRGSIFFSYCNKDKKLARHLFNQFYDLYPNLWFDDVFILGGDNYDKEIPYAIQNAQIFVALLTPQIAEDLKNGKVDNYYNDEWRMASKRKGELAIIPIAVEGFSERDDYYKKFEEIVGEAKSCINFFTEADAYSKLQKSIDKYLTNYTH